MAARNLVQYKKEVGEYTYPTKDNNMHDLVQEVASGAEQPYNYNPLTTAGLTLGLWGGDEIIDGVLTVHLATTVALTASATNYIERTRSGTVSVNTSGFTPGKEPLFTVVTDTGAIVAGGITDKRGSNRKTVGRLAKNVTGGTVVLAVDELRVDLMAFSGTLTSDAVIEVPAVPWVWPEVYNGTTGAYTLTLKVNGQTGIAVPQGKRMTLSCDGTDVRELSGYLRADGGAITGAVTMSGASATLTLAADPAGAMEATTKQYVDALKAGLQMKPSCRFMTTANVTLSGAQTVDGGTPTNGDRIFVPFQTDGTQNGTYLYNSAGAWTRTTDADSSAEVKAGMYVWITEGTTYADTAWVLTTNDPITLGSTLLTFVQFSAVGQINAGYAMSKSGPNTLDVDAATDAIPGASRFATLAEAIAGALTNVGITPDTLKGVARLMGYETISFPAGSLRPKATNGCAGIGTVAGAANQPDDDYLAFDGSATEYAKGSTIMPKSWDAGAIYALFVHRRASGTAAANVVLGLKARCFGDNESHAQDFGSGATVTAACSTTTANWKISGITGACTVAGSPAGGKKMAFEFYRAAGGSDTLTGVDCWISEAAILYKTSSPNDNAAVA